MKGGNHNQGTITTKTKIKQKHTIHDPNLQQTNPLLAPQVGQTGMTTGTSEMTRNKSSSSSSSSNEDRGQNIGLGTQPVQGLTGPTQMGQQGTMAPGFSNQGFSNQGYSQGMQNYPNTGITGTGYTGTGTMPMPVNQQGQLPPVRTEEKMTFVQKVKEKLHYGGK